MNYYNEFDPKAAWALRQLINDGLIPQGFVDERSIKEICPDELKRYTQCHFFAGIAGWSYALKLARYPADRPVWTGSCPCQPFSTAGKQKGKEDERHLWPVWFKLIRECRPPVIFGEQVSTAITHGWLDEVAHDLEKEGYSFGAAVLPACSVGAPHKRDRLWFVAHARSEESLRLSEAERRFKDLSARSERNNASNVAYSHGTRSHGFGGSVSKHDPKRREESIGLYSPNSFWDGDWVGCPDGKQRLVEPSICLLANGVSERVGLLRAAGNAIVPQVAAQFIQAFEESVGQ